MNWDVSSVGDITQVVTKGTTPKVFTESGVNYIKAQALNGDSSLDSEGFFFISEDTHEALTRSQLEKNDVLLTIAGAQIGKCGYVKGSHLPANTNQAVGIMRPDEAKVNPLYLYYFFKQERIFRFVQGLNAQAAQPNINLTMLKNIKIPLAPINTQNKIASILSAYDDLIENNNCRIALLEESARLLYREWFVRLRFPGHEHTRITDGVPDEWERGTVGRIAKLKSGYAFKSKHWLEQGNPVIKIKNIRDGKVEVNDCQCISDAVCEKLRGYILEAGNLLIAMTGATVGKVGIMPITEKSCYLNQRVGSFKPIQADCTPFLYTFFRTREAQKQVLNYAMGAAQPNISGKQLEGLNVLLPQKALMEEYNRFCSLLFKERLVLISQNQKLKAARDLLLPKLMNGEIPV